jgi:hypothetical protein
MTQTYDTLHYLPESEYYDLFGALRDFTTLLLFEFARSPSGVRDTVIRNFIARGAATLDSISRLWPQHRYGDCWALFRTLVDRLFHLHVLAERDEFELFDDWSFVKQFEARNRALSDKEFGPRLDHSAFHTTEAQKSRYKSLKAKNLVWSRPNPEHAARSLGLPFLYTFAYDFASTHVHPMANDGEQEFLALTGLKPGDAPLDNRVVLHNSALVHTVLLQHALNSSTFRWRNLIYDFVDAARRALTGDLQAYRLVFIKIGHAGPEVAWSERSSQGA